jgi:phage/plasmid-associated DNA primase
MEETHFISSESNQRESNAIMWSNQIQSLNPEEFMHLLSQLEDMWDINATNNSMVSFQLGYKNFINPQDLDPETGIPIRFDVELVSGNHKRLKMQLGQMYHRAEVLKLLDIEDDEDMKISMRINRLIDQVDDAWQIIFRAARIHERINNPTYVPINPESDPSIFRCSTIDKIDELVPYQQAILACLQNLYEMNIKRYKGYCCTQIKTDEEQDTRAWKQVETIQDYVYGVAQKETRYELWKNLSTRGSVYNDVIRHLTNCKDMQFPEIIKNRHVWSFKNGIFIGKEWSAKTGLYESRFYTYDSREFKNLDQTVVSCKYFDKEFTEYDHVENWYDIPTPFFQSILDYQKFDSEVSKWMYVMGGRLCFNVNDMDAWQIIPFLKGIARSGKSTLITKVFRKFYNADDVSTLSNNVEKKFGLSSIYDAFMFIAPEVKGDLQLEQAEFQSIVSGEDVSIAVKHEKAKSFEWRTPGILGGNEIPDWKDNSGSVLRRILTWNFGKQVKNADPTLENKLDTELPTILQKCIRAYLEYSQNYADKDIWNVVPEYFKTVQKQVATVANTLENFLQSTAVRYGSELFCPQKDFVALFNSHCQANNLGKPRFTQDFYVGPFSQRDIEVREDKLTYKGRLCKKQSFIFGIDIVNEDEIQEISNDY